MDQDGDEGIFGDIDLEGVTEEEKENLRQALLLSKNDAGTSQSVQNSPCEEYDVNEASTLVDEGREFDKSSSDTDVDELKAECDQEATDIYTRDTDTGTPSKPSQDFRYCVYTTDTEEDEDMPSSRSCQKKLAGEGDDEKNCQKKKVSLRKRKHKSGQSNRCRTKQTPDSEDETQPPDSPALIPESQDLVDVTMESRDKYHRQSSDKADNISQQEQTLDYNLNLSVSDGSFLNEDTVLQKKDTNVMKSTQCPSPKLSSQSTENDSQDGTDYQPLHRHYRCVTSCCRAAQTNFYAPAGVNVQAYVKVILQQLDLYRQELKLAQSKMSGRLEWGEPVKVGLHSTRTIDRKYRGRASLSFDMDELENVTGNDSADDDDFQDRKTSSTRRTSKRNTVPGRVSPDKSVETVDENAGLCDDLPELSVKSVAKNTNLMATDSNRDETIKDEVLNKKSRTKKDKQQILVEDTQTLETKKDDDFVLEPPAGPKSMVVMETQESEGQEEEWLTLPPLRKSKDTSVKKDQVCDNNKDNFKTYSGNGMTKFKSSSSDTKLNMQQLSVELNIIDENSNASANEAYDREDTETNKKDQPHRVMTSRGTSSLKTDAKPNEQITGNDANINRKRGAKLKRSVPVVIVEDTQDSEEEVTLGRSNSSKHRRIESEKNVIVEETQEFDGDSTVVEKPDLDMSGKIKSWFNKAKQIITPGKKSTEDGDSQSPLLKRKKKNEACQQKEHTVESKSYDDEAFESFKCQRSGRKGQLNKMSAEKEQHARIPRSQTVPLVPESSSRGVKRLFERPASKESNASDVSATSIGSSAMLDDKGDIYSTQISEIKQNKKRITSSLKTKRRSNVHDIGEKTEHSIDIDLVSSDENEVLDVKPVLKNYSRKKQKQMTLTDLDIVDTASRSEMNKEDLQFMNAVDMDGNTFNRKKTSITGIPNDSTHVESPCSQKFDGNVSSTVLRDDESDEDPFNTTKMSSKPGVHKIQKNVAPVPNSTRPATSRQNETSSRQNTTRIRNGNKDHPRHVDQSKKDAYLIFVNRTAEKLSGGNSPGRSVLHLEQTTKEQGGNTASSVKHIANKTSSHKKKKFGQNQRDENGASQLRISIETVRKNKEKVKVMTPCPLCNLEFSQQEIENHAATCNGVESDEEDTTTGRRIGGFEEISCQRSASPTTAQRQTEDQLDLEQIDEVIEIPEESKGLEICYICEQQYRKGEPHLEKCIKEATLMQAEVEARGYQSVFQQAQEPEEAPVRALRARNRVMKTTSCRKTQEAQVTTTVVVVMYPQMMT